MDGDFSQPCVTRDVHGVGHAESRRLGVVKENSLPRRAPGHNVVETQSFTGEKRPYGRNLLRRAGRKQDDGVSRRQCGPKVGDAGQEPVAAVQMAVMRHEQAVQIEDPSLGQGAEREFHAR